MSTTNMNIVVPTVGVTTGPTYANLVNAAFDTVDAHDHTTGKGVRIPTAGINMNADLEFNGYSALEIDSIAFELGGADGINRSAFVNGSGDLYYKNNNGTDVQITSGGGLAAVGSGIISFVLAGVYPYSVTSGNAQQIVGIDTTSARSVILPSAATSMAFWLKDVTGTAGTNNITVTPDGADTIDGTASLVINENSSVRGLVSNGTSAWYVF